MQIWNTYRSRWLGRFWQDQGCPAIPTVNWSDEALFDFCVDGIPPTQILTISVADRRRPRIERRFRTGVEAMMGRLWLRMLIIYDRMPFDPGCEIL